MSRLALPSAGLVKSFALFVAWLVEPITVPVCPGGVGVGAGGCVGWGVGCCVGCCVGCAVGDGCGAFVAEGEGFAVGDLDAVGVFCAPFVVPTVGVFPCVVAGAVDPAGCAFAICRCCLPCVECGQVLSARTATPPRTPH